MPAKSSSSKTKPAKRAASSRTAATGPAKRSMPAKKTAKSPVGRASRSAAGKKVASKKIASKKLPGKSATASRQSPAKKSPPPKVASKSAPATRQAAKKTSKTIAKVARSPGIKTTTSRNAKSNMSKTQAATRATTPVSSTDTAPRSAVSTVIATAPGATVSGSSPVIGRIAVARPASGVVQARKPAVALAPPQAIPTPAPNLLDELDQGADPGTLPNDQVFDETDQAQWMQLREQADIIRRGRLMNRPEQHPDFDGEHCVDCDIEIPAARLAMQRVRCVDCQQALEDDAHRAKRLRG